jgi:hypothetical protein
MLYEILLDAPLSNFDKTKQNYGPHADGIVCSTQINPIDQLTNQLQYLSIQHIMSNQTPSLVSPITQTSDVHTVKSTNPKGNQQSKGKREYKKQEG